jgi:hypothetical protein
MFGGVVLILEKGLVGVAEATRHGLKFIEDVVDLVILLSSRLSWQLVLFLGLPLFLFLIWSRDGVAAGLAFYALLLQPALFVLLEVDLGEVLLESDGIKHAACA